MKFILFTIIFLSKLSLIFSIIEIPLKSVIHSEKNAKFLSSLKFIQKAQKFPSFLQELPLHQQVIAQRRLSTYYGDIGVGTYNDDSKIRYFKMLFDTGSCEFWIPSEKCITERCKTHQRYTISQSFEEIKGGIVSIQYLSGKVQGDMARETIHIGDLSVPHQTIGIATEVQIPLLDEVTWDGILGLAYPNYNMRKKQIKPLFDNIINQNLLSNIGEKNQFAYYLGIDNGAISFGGADMRYKRSLDEEFLWSPIIEENYWTIRLLDVKKTKDSNVSNEIQNLQEKNERICGKSGCKSIIDTGTYLIYGPPEQIKSILQDLNIDTCSRKKELPNLIFEFEAEKNNDGTKKSINLVLTPDDYVLEFKIDNDYDCVIGIAPDNEDTGWTFGQVFLKAFYTVFDRDNNRIGFVRANNNPYPEPGKTETTTTRLKTYEKNKNFEKNNNSQSVNKRFYAKNSLNVIKNFDSVLRANSKDKEIMFSQSSS